MKKQEIELANKLKNSNWRVCYKDFYKPSDVVRYIKQRARQKEHDFRYNLKAHYLDPKQLFKKEVYSEGLLILKSEKLAELKHELGFLIDFKIPELEMKILKLEQK
jgi:hypothetical protein